MKDKNLFDMLENAEDDTMEKLTENCPEISDAKLEELLAETERRYTMKKKEIGKIRENTNTMNNEDSVSGVDRVKRPSWLRPLALAASFVLIAGTVVGSVALMKNAKPDKNTKSEAAATTQTTTADVKNIDKDQIIDLCKNSASRFDRALVSYSREIVSKQTGDRFIEEGTLQYDTRNKTVREEYKTSSQMSDGKSNNTHQLIGYYYNNRHISAFPDAKVYDIADTSENPRFFYRYETVSFLGGDMLSEDLEREKDQWSIAGTDEVCGRECAVLLTENEFNRDYEYIDLETGVVLKSSFEVLGNTSGDDHIFEVKDIKYNNEAGEFVTPSEFKKFIEDGGYTLRNKYEADGMASIETDKQLDLSFLDEPPVQQTEAPSVEETTSVETTDVTTQTTTEAVSEATVATQYTIPEFTAPEPENMFFNDELGKLALEMCKKEEIEYTLIVAEGGVQTDNSDYVMFSVDPKLEYFGYDPTKNEYSGGEPNNKVYYVRVNDSHFSDFEGFKKYARGLYSENSYKYKRLLESYADGFDDLEQGEMIAEKDMRYYIGYRGKLYKLFHIAGKGYLERRYDEEYPVIIADKTETSFRAIIPFDREYTQEGVDKVAEDKVNFVEVKFVLDTENGNWTKESNDWRIESVNEYYEDGVYKALADQIRAK